MIARWIALRALTIGLRHQLEPNEAAAAITRAFPRKTSAWRLELLAEAQRKAAARGT